MTTPISVSSIPLSPGRSSFSSWSHRALEGSFFFSSLVSPLQPLGLGFFGSLRPSVFFFSYVVLFLRRYGRRSGQPSSSSLARRACVHVLSFSLVLLFLYRTTLRHALRVLVFFEIVYWDNLMFVSALGLSGGRGEMAMAVASSARLAFLRGAVCACCTLRQMLSLFGPCTAMVH